MAPVFGEPPAYVRVADDLRRRILGGELLPGSKVPSRAQLAAEYGVSTNISLQAMRVLTAEGLIEGRPGSGTYVRDTAVMQRLVRAWYRDAGGGSPFAAETRAQGKEPGWQSASEFRVPVPENVGLRLEIAAGEPCVRTDYTFTADGKPVMLSTSWEPMAVTGGTPVLAPEDGPLAGSGVVDRMRSIGHEIVRVVEAVGSRPALTVEATRLGIAVGLPVITIERTYWTAERPVETADIVVPAERYQVVYEFPVGSR